MAVLNAQIFSKLTLQNPSPLHLHAPLPSTHIHVVIHYIVIHRDIFISPADGTLTVLRQYVTEPPRSSITCLDTLETMYRSTRQFIDIVAWALKQMDMPHPEEREHMGFNLARLVDEFVRHVPCTSDELHLEWTLERVEDRYLVAKDDEVGDVVAEELWAAARRAIDNYDDDCGMVPTAPEALAKLEVVEECGGGGEKNCVICLEELLAVVADGGEGGSKVVAMPCKHLFHEECIMSWLSTSHYCPVCRFEMPAAEEEEEEECGLVEDDVLLLSDLSIRDADDNGAVY